MSDRPPMSDPNSREFKQALDAYITREPDQPEFPFDDCPEDCENVGHCENTEGCWERLARQRGEL